VRGSGRSGRAEALCVGNAVADFVGRPFREFPGRGKLALLDRIGMFAGGCAVNTAVVLGRLGNRPGVVVAVGDDEPGRFLLRRLGEEGANTRYAVVAPRHPTSATLVLVSPDGERSFLHSLGANCALKESHVPAAALRRFRWLHLCGYFLLPGLDGAPSVRLLKRASKLGLATSLDVCWDSRGRWRLVRPCLPFTDYFMPSLEEARGILGTGNPAEISRRAFALGVRRAVVVKMGAQGCWMQQRGKTGLAVPSPKVRVVDATGAGDAFDAGFIAASLRGRGLVEAASAGCAAGALAVAGLGGGGAVRDWKQVSRLAGKIRLRGKVPGG